MSRLALIENGVVAGVSIGDQAWADQYGWMNIDAYPEVSVGWLYDGSTFTAPPPPTPTPDYVLSGPEWVTRFTDDEWAWLKAQRAADTNAGRQLDKFMDAIRWTDSIDVSSPNVDPFYTWLLNNGIPGGQARIDELRAAK